MTAARIVVVEDEAIVASNLGRRLTSSGHVVVGTFGSAEEMLERLGDLHPDLVLMDIKLAGRTDGVDAARQVADRGDTPVVFVTGYGDPETIRRVSSTHPYGCLIKPLSKGELETAVSTALVRHRLEQKLRESERRYRSLVDEIPVGLFRVGPNGRFLDVNPALVSMLGYPDDRVLLGDSIDDVVVEPDAWGDLARRLVADGDASDVEIEFRTFDGRLIWGRVACRAVTDDVGRVVHYQGTLQDISAGKRAERALGESESRFRDLADMLPVGVFEVDEGGRLVYLNTEGKRVLGIDDPKTEGDALRSRLSEHDRSRAARRAQRVFSGEKTEYEEYEYTTPAGDRKIICVSSVPVVADGRVVGIRGCVLDVTRRNESGENLLAASRLEATATLAGGVAHDLNNLMVGVLGNAQLLRMRLPENSSELVKVGAIADAARRAANLSNQLLAFAQGGKYHTEPICLNDVVRSLKEFQRQSLPQGIRMVSDLGESVWPVEADRSQMTQALTNLCMNAVEAISGKGTIIVRTRNLDLRDPSHERPDDLPPGCWVQVSVEDTGGGMSAHIRQRAFEPFFTTKFQGRGLGLAAVYGIVQNHGGHVKLSSVPNEGTRVTLYLPGVQDRQEAGEEAPESPVRGNELVMVVDDERPVRESVGPILEELGYRVTMATSSEQALEQLESSAVHPEVMLLDVAMPGMDGPDLFRVVHAGYPSIRVIVCSAHPLDDTVQGMLKRGAAGYLRKPFDIKDLATLVRQVLDT